MEATMIVTQLIGIMLWSHSLSDPVPTLRNPRLTLSDGRQRKCRFLRAVKNISSRNGKSNVKIIVNKEKH